MTDTQDEQTQRRERVEQAKAWLMCEHPNRSRTGGNDYIRCEECGFEWDYRRVHDPKPHAIDALIAAVRADAPTWQSIESAPKDGTGVLLFAEYHSIQQGNWNRGGAMCMPHWMTPGGLFKPTHWMPLPSPPSEAP